MFLFWDCKAPEKNTPVSLGCLVIGAQPWNISWEPVPPSIVKYVSPAQMKDGTYTRILWVSVPASGMNLTHKCIVNKAKETKEKPFQLPGEYPWTVLNGLVGLLRPTLS